MRLFGFVAAMLCVWGYMPTDIRAEVANAPAMTADHQAACEHYNNRARFKARIGDVEFVTVLAEACLAAERSLSAADEAERAAARILLDRLVELHDEIIAMNVERVFGRNAGPYAQPRIAAAGGLAPIPRVSATGEFLIAHRMGLIAALDAWLDSGAQFSLASR